MAVHFVVDNDVAPIVGQHFERVVQVLHPFQLVVLVFFDCPIVEVDIDDCNGLDYLQRLANLDRAVAVDYTVQRLVAQVDIEILL